MPDDSLGIDPNQTPPGDNPPETPPEPTPPATPQLTPESVTRMMQDAQGPVLEALQAVQHALAQQQQANTPPAHTDASELAERLLTDPDGVLKEYVTGELKGQLAAPLTRMFETDRDERIEVRAAEIDEEFGDGFFDTNIRPRLTGKDGALSRWPINQQADPLTIDSAINGLMGNDYRDSERRATMNDALAKTAKARQERQVAYAPHVMGPGRPRPVRTDTLTPDDRYTLEGMQRAGIKVSEADIKAAKGRDGTLESYLAQQGANR